MVQKRGPLLILKSDRSIELPRLHKTIVPNEATHFELVRNTGGKHQESSYGYDLILWHENQTYPILLAARASWKFNFSGPTLLTRDHLRSLKKRTPIENLYWELSKQQSGNLKTVSEIQNRQKQEYRTQNQQRLAKRSRMPSIILFLLGTAFTLVGGYVPVHAQSPVLDK